MKRIARIFFLNRDDHLRNSGIKSLSSSQSIGSFRALSRVRIHVFFLISLPIKSDFIFESQIKIILDLILDFSLFMFGNST